MLLPHLGSTFDLGIKHNTIHTSAATTFHAPSDLSSFGGIKHKCIHAFKRWRNGPGHYDTMLVNIAHDDDNSSSVRELHGLGVAQAHLFFSFTLDGVKYPCTLVHWFSHTGDVPSDATDMYTVEPKHSRNGQPVMSIIHLDAVFRAAHLLPVFINIQLYQNTNTTNTHLTYFQHSTSIAILIIIHLKVLM